MIYRVSMEELLSWYGVDLSQTASDLSVVEPPKEILIKRSTFHKYSS